MWPKKCATRVATERRLFIKLATQVPKEASKDQVYTIFSCLNGKTQLCELPECIHTAKCRRRKHSCKKGLNSYLTSAFIVLLKCVGFVHHWTHIFALTRAEVLVDSADEGKTVSVSCTVDFNAIRHKWSRITQQGLH